MLEQKFIPQSKIEKFKSLHRQHIAPYSIISTDPVIIYTRRFLDDISGFKSFKILFDYLKDQRLYILYGLGDFVESSEMLARIRQTELEHKKQYPNFTFFHLCNTLRQLEIFQEYGLQAVFSNHNCFLDENIFKPIPSISKKYDAVYDGRLVGWKRHNLAAKLENLALIYYTILGEVDSDYIDRTLKQFADAHFFNHDADGKYKRLQAKQVNEALNECRVGLCLSASEGAMSASGQYLLSGLPVVTTDSVGGRDEFFDESCVITVEATPDAVREGVAQMLKRDISADQIREKMLEKMRPHRQRFISLVQSIYEMENCPRNFASEWNKTFFHKLLKDQIHQQTIEILRRQTN